MHLTLEALARLLDEPPAPGEAAHLRDCLVCRREAAALREQTQALAALGGAPPAHAWDELEARLRREGLIRGGPPRRRTVGTRPGMRAAAAVALLLLGGSAGALLWPERTPVPVAVVDGVVVTRSDEASVGTDPQPEEVRYVATPPVRDASGERLALHAEPARPAAARVYSAVPEPPAVRATAREADRAARELLEAQAGFVAALHALAGMADPASGNDALTRLAALDRLVELTADALEAAPGDPVVNGYHLAAAAERDRLRREIERDTRIAWF